MSIVIAVKYKDGVALASDKQTTRGGIKTENSVKIKKADYSNTAIGIVGRRRDSNLLRTKDEFINYKDILDKRVIDENYVITVVVEKIFDILKLHDRLTVESGIKSMDSEVLFATEDKMYRICTDGSVIEFDEYVSVGCGEDSVTGYLNTVENLNKMNKEDVKVVLDKAIKLSCKDDVFINDKIDYIFLEKNKEILEEAEEIEDNE